MNKYCLNTLYINTPFIHEDADDAVSTIHFATTVVATALPLTSQPPPFLLQAVQALAAFLSLPRLRAALSTSMRG